MRAGVLPPLMQRLRFFYTSRLPESRVEKYFDQSSGRADAETGLLYSTASLDNEAVLKDYGIVLSQPVPAAVA
jgi:hypothetical protein